MCLFVCVACDVKSTLFDNARVCTQCWLCGHVRCCCCCLFACFSFVLWSKKKKEKENSRCQFMRFLVFFCFVFLLVKRIIIVTCSLKNIYVVYMCVCTVILLFCGDAYYGACVFVFSLIGCAMKTNSFGFVCCCVFLMK